MHRHSGFTLAELFIAFVIVLAAGFFIYSQWHYSALSQRDNERKTAINAMDAYLQQIYLAENGSYPLRLNPQQASAIQPNQLQDPLGRPVGDPRSDLRYEPSQCDGDACRHYTLRADLEAEADFIRTGTAR